MSEINKDYLNTELPLEERVDCLAAQLTLEEKTGLLLHESHGVERLDVPEYNWWNECLHGVAHAGKATVFPQAIAMSATFDVDLIKTVATAISDEARAKYHAALDNGKSVQYQGLTFWTPNINIFRDPRWGRGHETYGEDPYLTGEIGAAFVRGLQGDDPRYMKTAACAKHFAVHSGPERLRHEFDAVVSKRDMRETYLPAFKRLVKEGVESVMGAYNRVNGEPACAHTELMKILRDEWGFAGHFVSDCWAIKDFYEGHKICEGPAEAVGLAMEKGCDLNCGCSFKHALAAVEKGLLQEEWIDRSLKRLLTTRFKLGMFDPPGDVPYSSISIDVVDCDKHRALARKTAQESIVLLKNDHRILPLTSKIKSIYVTGHNAASIEALLGNYYGSTGRMVSVLEGIVERTPVDVVVEYHKGCLMDRPNPNPKSGYADVAKSHDVVIAVVGLSGFYEGEEGDALMSPSEGDRTKIRLPQSQVHFLNGLFDTGKPVVVVVLAGSAIAMPEIVDRAAAVFYAWYPGEEGGTAVADVLFGDVSPAGRLPFTIPKSLDQLPAFEDYSMKGRTYRFMDEKPLFRFGYGLSYTQFKYESLRHREDDADTITVEVDVTNAGDRDGDEVVQLYISDIEATVPVPRLHLEGFKRIHLKKGEKQTVLFTVTRDQLVAYDDEGRAFVEPGEFVISVGGGQPDDPTSGALSVNIHIQ